MHVELVEYAASVAVLSGIVLAATEAIGRATRLRKDLAAVLIGPLGGLAAYGAGFLPVEHVETRLGGWIMALFAGLAATAISGFVNDTVVKRVSALRTRPGPRGIRKRK